MQFILQSRAEVMTAEVENLTTRHTRRGEEAWILFRVLFAKPVVIVFKQRVEAIGETVIDTAHSPDKSSAFVLRMPCIVGKGKLPSHAHSADFSVKEWTDHCITKKLPSHEAQGKISHGLLYAHSGILLAEIVVKSRVDHFEL
jgi:hypothetical protein